ncbi:hypothetical protein AWB79_03106 [Caballeronia hypogeia]|uniref:Uncharacterized protein n=1 Tax=Caballeronia hypogeia TaxID=1777140 RepID=A0A158B3K9_9BURK|nr:hypothetical protein [Caballeronia hypogeia]SAK64346.1 hypothetical protein AWB79_03106 [Caballeronia hypogeia]
MTTTRRAFLIATGASGLLLSAFAGATTLRAGSPRIWVIDEDLPGSAALVQRALVHGARIEPLCGDAGWLWFERLSRARAIAGVTRGADAFVLTQLGAQNGMRVTQRMWLGGAVRWMLESAESAGFVTRSGSLE